MGELKYTVMDGCMLLNKSSQSEYRPNRVSEKKTSRTLFHSVSGVRTLTLTVEKLKKSSQMKLATGACKNWIFFAVDNFLPCIPVTIFPQYRAPVAGQPEAAPFGPCCSCSFLLNTWCLSPSELTEESRWLSCAFRPNEPYGFHGRKAIRLLHSRIGLSLFLICQPTAAGFLKFSQSYDMAVGLTAQVSLLILTEHFEVNTEMARQQ